MPTLKEDALMEFFSQVKPLLTTMALLKEAVRIPELRAEAELAYTYCVQRILEVREQYTTRYTGEE